MKQNSTLECKGTTHVLFVIYLPQQSVGSSFVGFQGDPWVSAHIDDLRRVTSDSVTLSEAMNMPISHLFNCQITEESVEQSQAPDEEMLQHLSKPKNLEHIREQAEPMMDSSIAEHPQLVLSNQQLVQPYFQPKPKTLKKSGYYLRLHGCIQAAASRLQDSAKNKERATERVKRLVELIPRSAANLGRLIYILR